jgi:hypothetical protein
MAYGAVKVTVLVLFVVYALVATNLRGSVQDVYPLFSWSLFSIIPNPDHRYTMEILEAGGTRYDPPLRFSQSSALFAGIQHSPTEYTPRVERLGQALANGHTKAAAQARQELNALFGTRAFRYRILLVYADPLEYWRNGSYRTVRTLGEFSSEDPS